MSTNTIIDDDFQEELVSHNGTLIANASGCHDEEQENETYPTKVPVRLTKTRLLWRQLMLVFGLRAIKPLMFELIFPFVSEFQSVCYGIR